jgi:DNA-binding MarR family transcriptional regulator
MAGTTEQGDSEQARIMLGLLESVGRGDGQTQRRLAAELGIALGLVNAYLKRCVNKGLVKIREAPARRFAYYLTPQGFAEKSRLTVEYLSYSFSLFRRARADYATAFAAARARGHGRVVLAGVSDLAEIATICAAEVSAQIVAVVDRDAAQDRFVGIPVVATYDLVPGDFDAVVVTDLRNAPQTFADAVDRFGADRVLAPSLLSLAGPVATPEVVQ